VIGFLIALFWVVLSKYIFDVIFFREVNIEKEIFKNKNAALSLSYGGYLLGLAFSFYSVYFYESFFREVLFLTFVSFTILAGVYLFDLLFLRRVDLKEEILKGNVGAGFTQGVYFVSMSVLISASFWRKESFILSILYSLLYLFLGMVMLFISAYLMSRLLKLNFEEEVKRGNFSASLLLGSVTFGVSVVLYGAISGEFMGSLLLDITSTVLYFLVSQVLMVIFYLVVEFLIFRKVVLSSAVYENNLSASLILSATFVASAFITLAVMG